MAVLKEQFKNEIVPNLMERFQYKNVMEVPHLERIVVNLGVGEARDDVKALDDAVTQLTQITGQKPIITRAKKSIANFKIRAGMPVGCKVTLRGELMYDFFYKLVTVALPRIRDFRGVSTRSFDGRGNFSLGIREMTVFPEIDIDNIDRVRGMDVIIVTSAQTDEEAQELLARLGMPFKKD